MRHRKGGQTNEAGGTEKETGPLGRRPGLGQRLDAGSRGKESGTRTQDQLQTQPGPTDPVRLLGVENGVVDDSGRSKKQFASHQGPNLGPVARLSSPGEELCTGAQCPRRPGLNWLNSLSQDPCTSPSSHGEDTCSKQLPHIPDGRARQMSKENQRHRQGKVYEPAFANLNEKRSVPSSKTGLGGWDKLPSGGKFLSRAPGEFGRQWGPGISERGLNLFRPALPSAAPLLHTQSNFSQRCWITWDMFISGDLQTSQAQQEVTTVTPASLGRRSANRTFFTLRQRSCREAR
ncbi:hypothetical protein EYF80_026395 [Liparis tanakae]|uniref:Uncharacterized protein n=1 Tax=Liparis tanakae TaxID=230148 RepID=A0A4Z2HEF9_9TELE|nr:hypothetical protein EYF80_026395 [Liparis tanakae]